MRSTIKTKLLIILAFAAFGSFACFDQTAKRSFVLGDSKQYSASLFRQNCAICHGPEADGKTLADGTVVPSLRSGEFKAKTAEQIHKQISEGGNGMLPFRTQFTERELNLMTDLVFKDLRGN